MQIYKSSAEYSHSKQSIRNHFVESMRSNLNDLNRSMQSIEKMIQQSRNIIQRSRQNSRSDTLSLEKHKNTNPKKITITLSPRAQYAYPQIPVSRQQGNENMQIYTEIRNANTHSRSKTSQATFGSQLKVNLIRPQKQWSKHEQNLMKFRPNVVKKQIELRKSGVKDKLVSAQKEAKNNTPEKTGTKHTNIRKSPYQTFNDGGNTVYKFSPQKISKSKERNNSKTTAQKNSKIKLRPTTRQINLTESFRNKPISVKDKNQNIRIEEQEDQPFKQEETNIHQKDELYRYKTQYLEEDSSNFSLSNYQLQSPKPKQHNQHSRNYLNQNDSSKHRKTYQSYRETKPTGIELAKPTPRQNRQILVKELQQLETMSTSEQERKAKFIMKIKKYGFVEKYLKEGEIWAIYDYLVGSQVPQLKWPIVIVDEVYKKMKSVK